MKNRKLSRPKYPLQSEVIEINYGAESETSSVDEEFLDLLVSKKRDVNMGSVRKGIWLIHGFFLLFGF